MQNDEVMPYMDIDKPGLHRHKVTEGHNASVQQHFHKQTFAMATVTSTK